MEKGEKNIHPNKIICSKVICLEKQNVILNSHSSLLSHFRYKWTYCDDNDT